MIGDFVEIALFPAGQALFFSSRAFFQLTLRDPLSIFPFAKPKNASQKSEIRKGQSRIGIISHLCGKVRPQATLSQSSQRRKSIDFASTEKPPAIRILAWAILYRFLRSFPRSGLCGAWKMSYTVLLATSVSEQGASWV
jgi:hypothetical protein